MFGTGSKVDYNIIQFRGSFFLFRSLRFGMLLFKHTLIDFKRENHIFGCMFLVLLVTGAKSICENPIGRFAPSEIRTSSVIRQSHPIIGSVGANTVNTRCIGIVYSPKLISYFGTVS